MTQDTTRLLQAISAQQKTLERIAKAAEQTNELLRIMLNPHQLEAHSQAAALDSAKRPKTPPRA